MSRRTRLAGMNAGGLLRQGLEKAPEEVGEVLPVVAGYRISRLLGRGSAGMVYEGWQESLQRAVAIKVLTPEHTGDALLEERLAREARLMAGLRHPNIVAVHDFVRAEDGGACIVMELIEGPALRGVLRERGTLTLEEGVALGRQIASGLTLAHDAGLTHRDLKPENVLLDRDGRGKVTDFGIAFAENGEPRLTLTGMRLGTEGYMAPEQAEAQPVDGRCDVYSLGVMLFEMLTGKLPCGRIDRVGVLCPQIPEALCGILVRAVQPDREKRFSTMREFGEALEGVEVGGECGQMGWWRRLRKRLGQLWG